MDRSVDPGMRKQLQGISGWRGMNNPWMPEDDSDREFVYINLLENVERYTGYKASLVLAMPLQHLGALQQDPQMSSKTSCVGLQPVCQACSKHETVKLQPLLPEKSFLRWLAPLDTS